jgi:hypothetical protein
MCGYGNEHVTNLYETYFWVNICAKEKGKVVVLVIFHENNPSSYLLVEIKMRYDTYVYLVKYNRRKSSHLKDKLKPCSPSHEPLSYYIAKMGDAFVEEHIAAPHVEDICHEVSTSSSHEDKGSVTCNYVQNSSFDDANVNLESIF